MHLSPFFLKCYSAHRDLHSFPTRRSSDLDQLKQSSIQPFPSVSVSSRTQSKSSSCKGGNSPFWYSLFTLRMALHMFSDRKSTRLNSSHVRISYAVFCLKKKKKKTTNSHHN